MEPGGSKQDGGVVNMTRAMEALSPWLNHPRRTIIQVEALVLVAAALLLLQLILGSCRQRWHNSFIKCGLQVCNGIMFPLIVYTLGTMQSSPIKNSSYPVWAGFLIMASAGTTVQQYDFYESFFKKYIHCFREFIRYLFYLVMFVMLTMNPNYYNLMMVMKKAWDLKLRLENEKSSLSVVALVLALFLKKVTENYLILGSKGKVHPFLPKKNRRTQDAQGRREETAEDRASDSDPQSMKGYKYSVCHLGDRYITIEQIWDCCGNSADGKALKDLCLSCALFWRLLGQHYFGQVYRGTRHLEDHEFVFKKLLPSDSEEDFQRAFRVIEVELGFCHDFFFTKYISTFYLANTTVGPLIPSLFLMKIILILLVGVFAIKKSLVLETPNPIIEVHISEADYIITLLVLSIALLVELVDTVFYLASNWAQVSLACIHVKKQWFEPSANIFGKFIGLFRWLRIYRQLRNKIDQQSVIFGMIQQPDPVAVSDATKKAIAKSLRSTYANNLTADEEASVRRQNQMLGEYFGPLNNLSQLEVILICHIATEYCDAISDDPSNGNGTTPSSNDRGVAVHLSRYCAYLIGSVPELLPYHEADIAELTEEVMEERNELFKSCNGLPQIYNEMKSLEGTQEADDPTTMFKKGVKLGKQLERKPDRERWELLQDFWAKKIIHAAAVHYTAKQHMQHLEDGGEFLTHIWALLAHAGILSLNRNKVGEKKDQGSQTDIESGPSVAV